MTNTFRSLAQNIPCNFDRKNQELFPRLTSIECLLEAWTKVRSRNDKPAQGSDEVTTQHLVELQQALIRGVYEPLPTKNIRQPKTDGSFRFLKIPAMRDRVLQRALLETVQPLFNEIFDEACFPRPNRSAHDAIRTVRANLQDESTHVVKIDIENFFNCVEHSRLQQILRRRIGDKLLLRVLCKTIEAMGHKHRRVGISQGAPLSPFLGTVYLTVLDKTLRKDGFSFVRYVDDIVAVSSSIRLAERANRQIAALIEDLGLSINTQKSGIHSVTEGFEFVGYRFIKANDGFVTTPSDKSIDRFQARIRELLNGHERQHSCSCRLRDLAACINPYVRGWGNYYQYIDRTNCDQLDDFISKELRRHSRRCDENLYGEFFYNMTGLQRLSALRMDFDAPKSP